MKKKYIFFDLDGTLLSHSTGKVNSSTIYTLQKLRENGHETIIATGRPPALFFGIDKELGFHSYIASNGALCVHNDEVIFKDPIETYIIDQVLEYTEENNIDVGFESLDYFCVHSKRTKLVENFCNTFHLPDPPIMRNHHKENDIFQLVLFYDKDDFKKFEKMFNGLWFNYSNPYGLDVNKEGGLKDQGLKVFAEKYNLDSSDIIAVGDGFNDVTMLQYAGIGIAMGNASEHVKEHADIIAPHIDENGVYQTFVELGLIKKAD